MKRIVLQLCLAVALLPLCSSLAAAGEPAGISILPAHTRVGLATVKLQVSDLAYEGAGLLVGTYQVKIPLAPWRDDRGDVWFELDEPLERTLVNGGVVAGNVQSAENGRVHPVTCRIESDGSMQLTIETHERTLRFDTRVEGGS